ncbi:hypothetical protein Tco_0383111 [Tanacetum coccineum]
MPNTKTRDTVQCLAFSCGVFQDHLGWSTDATHENTKSVVAMAFSRGVFVPKRQKISSYHGHLQRQKGLMWLQKKRKSSLYGVGVSQQEADAMASFLRCRSGSLPFVYLGLLVGLNMNRVKSWNIVVEKLKEKLSNWKARTLSFAGRLTLVRSGGSGDSRKMAWVKWENVMSKFELGG